MTPILRAVRILLALSITCAGLNAAAFIIWQPQTVIEYHNALTDEYFLTADESEAASLDSVFPAWHRTGLGFRVIPIWACPGCVPVDRFVGASHFYTANANESAMLKSAPGMSFEGVAFGVYPPTSQCFGGTYVYRLFDRRSPIGNHRYVPSTLVRDQMVAAGWTDEGIAFCANAGSAEIPLKTYPLTMPLDGKVMSAAQCRDESINLGGCMAIANLPVPATLYGFGPDQYFFRRYTGLFAIGLALPAESASRAAEGPFIQTAGDRQWGIHLEASARGAAAISSVSPMFKFSTAADRRVFPWGPGYPFETQLAVSSFLDVMFVNAKKPGSQAYGHTTVELIDRVSGHHLLFNVLAYGTIAGGEFAALDATTGHAMVGTSHRQGSPYGRNLQDAALNTPFGTDWAPNLDHVPVSYGGNFQFRTDRTEFKRVLAQARSLDPALSADPSDYYLDNYHFRNEAFGDAEIGLQLGWLSLDIMRR